ncbi:SAICAR synthase-like protein [Atractiella rhizophila]|nr:SAICAR synthase-like protein [Atractiella rhizophila]
MASSPLPAEAASTQISTPAAADSNQAGGHKLAITERGAFVDKLTLRRERDFYEVLCPSLEKQHGIKLLGEWVPAYGGISEEGEKVEGKEKLVLESLVHEFLRPNVLDVKLGVQFWDEDSSAEKRERMDKETKRTTSGTTGVRFTAFQVWNASEQKVDRVDKTYGKTIKPTDLPSAIRRFFPIPSSSSSPLLSVVRDFISRLQEFYSLLERLEIRVRGGSLLFVYEGDEQALRILRESGQKGWQLRMIDFAHARTILDGESGPDEGLLMGVKTLIKLLNEWVLEVEAL